MHDQENQKLNLAQSASRAFLWNQGLFIANSMLMALTTYILARFLEPENYGIYTAAMAFGSLAALLVAFGYEDALNVYLPRYRLQISKLRYLFSQLLKRRIITVLVLCLVMVTSAAAFGNAWLPENLRRIGKYLDLAVLCGGIALVSGLSMRALITLFRVKALAGIRLMFLTATLGVYTILLVKGYGIRAILWTTILTSTMAMSLYIIACRDLIWGPSENFPVAGIYRFGRTAWVSQLIGYLLGKNIDVIIMTFYGVGAAFIGFYHIAFNLIAYARMLVTKGMTGVLQSAFSSAYQQGGAESLGRWWQLSMKFQILVVSPGVLFLVLFSQEILETVLPGYSHAANFVRLHGIFALAITMLGSGTHITALYAIGNEKIVLVTRVISGLLNLLLDLILIYFWGALGAIIATGVSGLVAGCFELKIIKSKIGIHYPLIFFVKCAFCLLCAGVFASLLAGNGIMRIIFCGLSFFSGYLVAAFLIRPLEGDDVIGLSSVSPKLGRSLSCFSKRAYSKNSEESI
ncbi:MAG: oligosaccharide flippase family protein [Desulfobacterales bacterium]|jgi:O-antigen/teichoic acid export membrane protein